MSDTVIQVDSLWKKYRLGVLGTGTLRHDFNRWLHRIVGKPDPYAKVGEGQKSEERRAKSQSRAPISDLPSSTAGASPSPLSALPSPSSSLRDDEMWALRDISFEVKQGEILGIIGKNGAGKSTLLKILSRVTAPTSGEVRVKGRIASLLEVGTGFHPELTGRENIFLNGAILGMTKGEIKAKLDEIVAFSEVEKFIDTPVKRYSSGMYVRLAFAVAAHLDPEILIVDEVLAVGDAAFQKKCLSKMKDVAGHGRAILFVSHNMAAVASLCNTAMWLTSGAVNNTGSPASIVSAYATDGSQKGAEVSYTPPHEPGNHSVRLRAVRIRSKEQITTDVLISAPIHIEYDYTVLHHVPQLIHCIHIRDKYDAVVFVSANFPSACLTPDPAYSRRYAPGLYCTTCTIPANLLNEDVYSVDVGILDASRRWILWEKSLVSLRVYDTGEMKSEYFGDWIGVIRPKLNWVTKCYS